jgi:hypothetical protein
MKGCEAMSEQRLLAGILAIAVLESLLVIMTLQTFPSLYFFSIEPGWKTIDTFQGSGSKDTPGFLVSAPWRLE